MAVVVVGSCYRCCGFDNLLVVTVFLDSFFFLMVVEMAVFLDFVSVLRLKVVTCVILGLTNSPTYQTIVTPYLWNFDTCFAAWN
jgi:hypothetical protein